MWCSASSKRIRRSARVLLPAAVFAAVVGGGGAAAAGRGFAAASVHAHVSAAGPSVQTMVVGRGGSVLGAPRTVSASAAFVHVRRRSCSVAAGTPLAALAALRASGGPAFALRDYGHCGSSQLNAGQLFVYQLGSERNSGQNGWEYKVGHVAGTTGAADTSGWQGNGRLLSYGQRVLWFWCAATAGGCQRTLDMTPSTSTVALGATFTVRVDGYDNNGRGAAIAGATVTLGSGRKRGVTASNGVARLSAPKARGSYVLHASKHGVVPAFADTIVVR